MTLSTNTLEQRFSTCVHCGLCLEHCPTYVALGHESDSPRGRIVLMRGLHEGRIDPSETVLKHLGLCLDCRACETACPSGVRYGSLIEDFRAARPRTPEGWGERLLDHLLFDVFPDRHRLARWLRLGRLGRAIGAPEFLEASGLAALLPAALDRLQRMLPDDGPAAEPLRPHYAPRGPRRRRAFFFVGCVGEAVFAPTNRATLRVLSRNGVEVDCPQRQTCCGAIHHHAGRLDEARALARENIAAFSGGAPIVTNIAGCGAMLKHYGELLAGDPTGAGPAREFSRRVLDVSEYLAAEPLVPPPHAVRANVTYHDPCHLCHAQGIRRPPRELLQQIPGVQLLELAESELCCGAAGTYNLTQPEMSAALGRRKVERIVASGASIVATGNAGCILQIRAAAAEAGAPVSVAHPIDLLDRAYGAA